MRKILETHEGERSALEQAILRFCAFLNVAVLLCPNSWITAGKLVSCLALAITILVCVCNTLFSAWRWRGVPAR